MNHAIFSVILAVLVLPAMPLTDAFYAGPCNPEVQDCP
ncbi:hypothetical protein SAMN05216236_102266 [Sedimentitalea nanhaiensis]|uniref:Uncharacterized protein n=1 Tax=Sedimentitalea nanhaiensis TaxID=999627 RepID=A0A1I6YKP7_9RHOB|nr:hypothetical protein SAMN05216236_102266 [Sedimentitalea nanhaiensis]